MMRHRSPSRQHAGIALIEVMVAVLLVSFGLLGLISLVARGTQYAVGTEDSQRAALLAGEMSAAMWGVNSVNVPAAALAAWQLRVADVGNGGLPSGEGSVTVTAGVARIALSWRPPQAAAGETNRYFTEVEIPPPPP